MFFDGYDLYVARRHVGLGDQPNSFRRTEFLSLTFVGMTLGYCLVPISDRFGGAPYQINLLIFPASLAAALRRT